MILLAELALRTSRIGLGTSVISAWGRTPATIALGAAGLQRCSGGRFSLGIGAGSPPLTEGFHGIAWDRPVLRLRETLTAVRGLLAGDRLPSPAPGARPLRLGVLPEVPVPIVLAALSSGSIRLAGELADGWAPFLWARSRVQDGLALLREGESRVEVPAPTRVCVGVPVALGPDENSARRLAAWWLSTYVTRMGPLYPRMLGQRFGMAAGVDALIEAARSDRQPELPAPRGGSRARSHAPGDLRSRSSSDRSVVRCRCRQRAARVAARPPRGRTRRDREGRGWRRFCQRTGTAGGRRARARERRDRITEATPAPDRGGQSRSRDRG